MATPQPDPEPPTLTATLASPLLASFTTFLTVTFHTILYHRRLYAPTTFLTARAYNLPVHQSRHPGLCTWIADAVAAIAEQLRAGAVRRVVLAVHEKTSAKVIERWVFDVEAFPVWGEMMMEEDEEEQEEEEEEERRSEGEELNWADVDEALRGALRRISYAAEGMPKVPDGSTFTVAVELRDEAPAPIGHPQPWIPSQPQLQPPTETNPDHGTALGGASTTPIRSVQAGPLFFECWVEQGAPETKEPTSGTSGSSSQFQSQDTRNKPSSSYFMPPP